MITRSALWLVASLLLGACASTFPDELTRSVDRSLTFAELQSDPEAHVNRRVMLGGEILDTRPRPGETEIEVLARQLRRDDSPDRSDRTAGRFLARTAQFLDPAVYAQGRRVTVVGVVTGGRDGKIGDLPYRYPIITVDRIHLWPREAAVAPPYPYYYYDPYFYYWPYPYGYRRHYLRPFGPWPYWW